MLCDRRNAYKDRNSRRQAVLRVRPTLGFRVNQHLVSTTDMTASVCAYIHAVDVTCVDVCHTVYETRDTNSFPKSSRR